MRAFLAIEPPVEVLDALERIQSDLPVGRAVPVENLHLTLAFLDDQPEDRLEDLHYALEGLRLPSADVSFDGLGTFGGDRPRILFAAVRPAPSLLDLHRLIAAEVRRAGIVLPRETFRPHVTLARLRRDLSQEALVRLQDFLASELQTDIPPFTATSLTLFESDLHPGGARYDALSSYPLV
ncbi:RNA 2',3'-cyclic phosphodiesterase [Chachezhania sediminis]|uniref:RNA 2',3'-cyclic phosphodiesterase n=1 Tax=Chachezhania sediminis TaxID=2599291 RepID=UPI00131D2809|nr:RNA 2',3'-cyclic phosphodiesterase [Chachezhania sediminis]